MNHTMITRMDWYHQGYNMGFAGSLSINATSM